MKRNELWKFSVDELKTLCKERGVEPSSIISEDDIQILWEDWVRGNDCPHYANWSDLENEFIKESLIDFLVA